MQWRHDHFITQHTVTQHAVTDCATHHCAIHPFAIPHCPVPFRRRGATTALRANPVLPGGRAGVVRTGFDMSLHARRSRPPADPDPTRQRHDPRHRRTAHGRPRLRPTGLDGTGGLLFPRPHR
ncbi:hypothetical protein BMON_1909 [Bifidobacterium mongoliense DSM 21395]|uniref:Uncharacterized protein n=1 Tax=Bifidobacterium mongoliense DSM 21395 TaxID=1437603 RepID=A0A087CAC1_9BIFI|nr:hypothetical protein BMON_1909 [Bifidobacterium mongoliense DSM 21395]